MFTTCRGINERGQMPEQSLRLALAVLSRRLSQQPKLPQKAHKSDQNSHDEVQNGHILKWPKQKRPHQKRDEMY